MAREIDPMARRAHADYLYTDEALPAYKEWDRRTPIDIWKHAIARAIKIENARRSKLLSYKNADGVPLYKLTEGGSYSRTFPLSSGVRNRVVARDGACVECGAGGPFEVDHIIRYVDGGSNDMGNLQTLCVHCHRKKGGR